MTLIHIKKPRRFDNTNLIKIPPFEVKVDVSIAEILSRKKPTVQEYVAVKNTFGESTTPAELMKKYGIDSDAVIAAVKRIMER